MLCESDSDCVCPQLQQNALIANVYVGPAHDAGGTNSFNSHRH